MRKVIGMENISRGVSPKGVELEVEELQVMNAVDSIAVELVEAEELKTQIAFSGHQLFQALAPHKYHHSQD